MSAEWYYQFMGLELGPLNPAELRTQAKAGQIRPETLVRKGIQGQWVSADRVKGLFGCEPSKDAAPIAPTAQPSPPTGTNTNSSEKACPMCGEVILAVAKKCKHCGEYLDDSLKKPGKAVFKASGAYVGLASYHITDETGNVLAKLKPNESFQVPVLKDTVMKVKYSGGFAGPTEVKCFAHEVNRFSITLSQFAFGCVVSRVDVIDSD